MYEILFSFQAENEIEDAAQWYESQRKGLGFEFSLAFDEALHFLETNPKMYAVIYKEVRSVLLKKFPYSIFYILSESKKEVYIFAVIHSSRDPEIWQSRVELT